MKYQHGYAFPDADVFMCQELRPDGTYQGDHLDAAVAFVTDWSCAIDGGAHVGTWSRRLAMSFARVIAVEPSPDTYEALITNLTAFGCAQVEPRQVALGAASGAISMTWDAPNQARANTGARFVQANGAIPLETIDDWHLPTLGFLKLDIEGSEFSALMGARQTLARCRPIVLFEDKGLWRRFGVKRDGPQKLLTANSYRRLMRVGCDEIWGPA